MGSLRLAALSAVALLTVSGCRTAGVDNLARQAPIAPAASLSAQEIVDEHNRNAERITILQGRPTLSVTGPDGRTFVTGGMLALEQPRNFRLAVKHDLTGGEYADIGSNDERFWYWVRGNKEKLSYYCDYKDLDSTPIDPIFQPDWIVESLGLRVIPDDEAKGITVTRGDTPDTLVLTHPPTRFGGDVVVRKMIVQESTRRIVEYRLYSDRMALLAKSSIGQYQKIANAGDDAGAETVLVPSKLKLEWLKERLSMDVSLPPTSTTVNKAIPEKQRSVLWVERPHRGYQRFNLAKLAPPRRARAEVRETRPAPPTGVELGTPQPSPLGIDAASRTSLDPVALTADLSPPRTGLVGPDLPRAPEPQYAKPSSAGWRRFNSTYYEQ